MIKYITVIGVCAVLTSCGSTGGGGGNGGGGGQAAPVSWKTVPGVTTTVNGMREVMKAKVDGKEVVAMLTWRNYSQKLDGAVTKWYGDMGTPPPKFVVDSLLISIDGKGTIVPKSKSRYLASQWMNGSKSLGLVMKNKNLCVFVNVGDGGESWTASYEVNPSTGSLISHEVVDGPEFHNRLMP
ncbi:MAG: hypothetical protein KJO79_10555 [Verrucomicrobiae bacterium]|nr:hypothetical protein [Verrucomicrobiae bacterium]NNJ87613.1 hypothetical protein [Akkermansiaceae bacterium]